MLFEITLLLSFLGIISCSLCKIACWCGPECLESDFASHKIACTVGEQVLQELQL